MTHSSESLKHCNAFHMTK